MSFNYLASQLASKDNLREILSKTGLIFITVSLLACSVSSTKGVRSESLAQTAPTSADRWEFKEIARNPYLYKRVSPEGADYTTYLSALVECSGTAPKKLPAVSRQLLVGFESLEILRRKQLELADATVFKIEAQAKLDGEPVYISAFTTRDKACVRDLVLWFQQAKDKLPDNKTLSAEVESFVPYLENWLAG